MGGLETGEGGARLTGLLMRYIKTNYVSTNTWISKGYELVEEQLQLIVQLKNNQLPSRLSTSEAKQ